MNRIVRLLLIILMAAILWACQKTGDDKSEQPQPTVIADASQAAAEVAAPDRYLPVPDLPQAPDTIRIAVISDINGSYGTVGYSPLVRTAVSDIVERKVDFVVSPGDLVAGQMQGLDYDAMWKGFHYQIGDVFFDNDLEFIFAPGNHDASSYPGHETERAAYARAFEKRQPRAPLLMGSQFPFYYGVKIRDILVIALDINRPIKDNDPQLDWLETTLETQASTRLNIVLGHLPLSPINLSQFVEVAGSPRLLSILRKTPSTMYISGHHHIYYPGHIGELRTVSAPALGNGPRGLFGAPPIAGYVIIEVPPHSPARVTSLVAPDFKRMVDIESLPRNIVRIEREDVGMAEYIMEMLDDKARQ